MWACVEKLKEGLQFLLRYLDALDKQDELLGLQFETCGDAAFICVFRSKRPPNPEQTGRVIRDKAAGGRSGATLEFCS